MASVLEKFLTSKCKKNNIIVSDRSKYYNFNGRVIRVSDHVGKNSSGIISVIIPGNSKKDYIVHFHSNGSILYFNYVDLKAFLQSFILLGNNYTDISMNNKIFEIENRLSTSSVENFKGVAQSIFTDKQIAQINAFLNTKKQTRKFMIK